MLSGIIYRTQKLISKGFREASTAESLGLEVFHSNHSLSTSYALPKKHEFKKLR